MLKTKIRNKEKTIGMYVQLSDMSISHIAGLAGYDFVWVDTEHSYMSTESLIGHVYALKSTGTPVIVRLPQNDLTATKHVVELGVDGIIFPMVRTAEECNRLIASTLYPPYGDRGFGPMGAIDFGHRDPFEYVRSNHVDMCRFIQIEHKDAVENLPEIIKNEYIDGYIIGPNDLCGSYNMLGEHMSDKAAEIIKPIVDFLHANNKYVAIASGGCDRKTIGHWADFGVDMLTSGADFDFIREGAKNNRMLLEELHKNKVR